LAKRKKEGREEVSLESGPSSRGGKGKSSHEFLWKENRLGATSENERFFLIGKRSVAKRDSLRRKKRPGGKDGGSDVSEEKREDDVLLS